MQLTRQQANNASVRIQNLDQSIVAVTKERYLAVQRTQRLEQELKTAQTQVARSTTLEKALESRGAELKQLQHHNQELKELEALAWQDNKQLSHQNKELEELKALAWQDNEQLNHKVQSLNEVNEQLAKERKTLQAELEDSNEQLEWFRGNWSSPVKAVAVPQLKQMDQP
ncbi:hypothetical protein H6F43_21765 [Leptolyngbya sp. FACHB-36]|uniref:hypothetical protein n=1 Tax=Leptolyngbya sp. FACHB-36 TaxID=2692808 RepID=UPI001680C4A2|nr:hypothetical protein [Leptolyngbya sp. FACHB-36]MBD2022814.1 hypothetical protein [Leptolyngbya sp. FACHB-36]